MQTILRNILLLVMLVLLSACTTTSSTFTTPYSTSTGADSTSTFDKEKAARTRLDLGIRYLNQGDYEKAKFSLDKALKINPDSEDVQRTMAHYYQQVNEENLAIVHYKKALAINNKNPALLNQYGAFLCQKGRLEESLKMFMASVQIATNKNVSRTYENAAICSLKAKKKAAAENYYRKALNHNPEQGGSLLGMAIIEFDKARYNRTRSYLTRFEKVRKHNSRSLWVIIRTESKLGNMDAVASYGIKLEQLFPDSKETAIYLDTRNQWLK